MRLHLVGPFFLATALSSAAFAASNSAHVCGDIKLSANDQMDCRTQMDAARTEGERLQVQHNFEKLSASVTGEAGTTAAQRNAAKTNLRNNPSTPHTNPATTPADSYPPAESKPPVYPGETPDPKTGKPPA
ncbi:MAG: hypothetical protein ACYCZX_17710 [Rhodospirillaceae bacterium]